MSRPERMEPLERMRTDHWEKGALGALLLFNATAAIGFATFGVNPELLARFPGTVPFFALSFRLFSIGQILVAAGALILVLVLRLRLRWLAAFAAIYVVSLSSELSGTAFGFPFGAYAYTTALGPQWLGLVPLVIPLSWFMMAIPSFALARWFHPQGGPLSRVMLGALILTAWDLALDPAMSYATIYWRWEVPGTYYGMPWINLGGWLFTSALLMGAMVLLRGDRWIEELPIRWVAIFYAANVALPLAMAAAAGLGWAVVTTIAAYLWLGGAVWLLRRSPSHRPAEAV
jgi:uncharacterized membrane protein